MRWFSFNSVGILGIGVQMATLGVLTEWLGLHYLVATGLAVETTIIHNFVWHAGRGAGSGWHNSMSSTAFWRLPASLYSPASTSRYSTFTMPWPIYWRSSPARC